MENNILVSILVPFYNVEKYIGKCVESLFRQSYENIEYIFVNDCTPDNSLEIIKSKIIEHDISKNKYKIINHKKNLGISVSRNDCISNAKGDFILFIDSDDWIDDNMVELLVNKAKEKNADITGCGYIEEYEDKSIEFHQKYTNDHHKMMKDITVLTLKGVLWKLLIKRSIIVTNNLKFITEDKSVEDYFFCCQVFYYSQTFASVDKCLYHYIQYNQNNYSHKSISNIESQILGIKKTEMFYKEKGIYNELEKELKERKFILKLPLILDKECINTIKWKKIFPESNKAWYNMNFSWGNKLIFIIAQSHFHPLIKFLRIIKK